MGLHRYLPPGSGHIPAFTPEKLLLESAPLEACKAEDLVGWLQPHQMWSPITVQTRPSVE